MMFMPLLGRQAPIQPHTQAGAVHPAVAIPARPRPYVAHAYSLLQTGSLVGRARELAELGTWLERGPGLLSVVAIGGMGKSALTWKWFSGLEEAPRRLEGRLWWSFYESDARFENFVARAVAGSPSILLADEPTGNLDSKNARLILELLVRLHDEQNMTLVLVTHDISIAEQASRIVEMKDGRVVSDSKVTVTGE